MSGTSRRLDRVYRSAALLKINKNSRLVLMSDCHRGQGNNGDNFLKNQNLFTGALAYYYKHDFSYIELGDGDELWENRNMKHIIENHSDVFSLMSRFYQKGRLHMIFGNHDTVKSRRNFIKKRCEKYYCNSQGCRVKLFPDLQAYEGIILEDEEKHRALLVHGHQGSFLNDTMWPVARFLVRYIWRPLELVGFSVPTGSGMPNMKKAKIERELSRYADKNNLMLIAGHTHRPVFSNIGSGKYFNDGSCVHPDCITAIEIEAGEIRLVKWQVSTAADRTLFVDRRVIAGPQRIADYFPSETNGK